MSGLGTNVEVRVARTSDGAPMSPRGHAAADRITRSAACVIGLGGVMFAVIDSHEILHQSRIYAGWWTIAAAIGIFGACLFLALASFLAPLRTLNFACTVLAVNFLVVVGLSCIAVEWGAMSGEIVWIFRFVMLGAVAAGLVWRAKAAIGYLVAVVLLAAVGNAIAHGSSDALEFALNFTRILGISAVFTWIMVRAKNAALYLDLETWRAQQLAASAAASEARTREKGRFAALIHDGVLATLLDASRGGEPDVLARQAGRTLRQFDEIRATTIEVGTTKAQAALAELRTAATEAAADVHVELRRGTGWDSLAIPPEVVRTLGAATAEALRNSVRHAGRTAHRNVTIDLDASGICVQVTDDGVGFDPAIVPDTRLGIALSIRGRMSELPGGSADIASRPGAGTTVTLRWEVRDAG